ncbi:MAG: oleate hydratase, partial [Roseburia sp.]|nr:oleate hydratase [Roseburia sp.]
MASKKSIGIGVAAVAAAGAGAAAIAAKNYKKAGKNTEKKPEQKAASAETNEYRNTERGKDAKNSKGIYYTN